MIQFQLTIISVLYTMLRSAFLLILLVHNDFAQDEMTAIGDAVEAFAPCDEFVLSMERVIGGRPQLENYWDGTFYLNKWPNLTEVRVSLTVDNPAKIEFDKDLGRVLVSGRTFHISTYDKPPTIDEIRFKIQGPAFGAFPNVERITLNDLDVCKNPRKVTEYNGKDFVNSVMPIWLVTPVGTDYIGRGRQCW